MAFADFAKNITRVLTRSGNGFLFDSGALAGEEYAPLGRIKNMTIGVEPVMAEADSTGREKMLAANVTVSLTMTQTADEELANLELLADPANETDAIAAWSNGLTFVATSDPTTASDLSNATYTGEKFTFVNCLPSVGLTLDFNGETEGVIELEIMGRVPLAQLREFGGTKSLSFDT